MPRLVMRLTAAEYRASLGLLNAGALPIGRQQAAARPSKYGNKRTEVDGIWFDSLMEARHYGELKLLERAGQIANLECHPKLPVTINGVEVCTVAADFAYFENGKRVLEDCKGRDTPVSRLKRKLVCASYPGIDWRIIKK